MQVALRVRFHLTVWRVSIYGPTVCMLGKEWVPGGGGAWGCSMGVCGCLTHFQGV